MQIILRGPAAGYEAEHTARIFFPGAEKAEDLPETEDFVLAESHEMTDLILVRKDGRLYWRTDLRSPEADPEYALCKLEFGLLKDLTGIDPPWGMMTGVRPVRIIHDLRAAGESEKAIAEKFLDHFACTPEKFKLALGIADLQRPVLDAADPMDCSIYAGIPFCPTRCSYCSFVSRTVGDKATRALVQPYVDKLCRELTAIRETTDRCGLRIRTFYIGGGTPTALSAAQLEQLMSHIARTFDLAALDEYTVEAGRPDCTDAEKLRIIKQYGATRISINPQTFSDEVLRNIGRRHTAQDIIDCFAAARAAGHTNINMDLIAGLPGDTVEGFTASLRQAIALDPENITVHTLTLKRASNLVVEHRAAAYDDVSAMLESCRELADVGYRPYYMYRQKGTLQNLENIGWAKPGCECLYNIYIMEEIHTILSAGAGGSTKLVIPGQRRGKIERIFNFKYPTEYIDRFEEILARKQGVEDFMRATQQRKRFVSRELVALAANQPQAFADYSEGQYRAQIESIADEVLSSGRHIVMLTGPSAAGKTTSAHKIADAIAARGCRSAVVSLDDFYAGAGRYPKHPDGTDDYESLGSLDLPVLQECLAKLHTEGVCKAPIFDFKIQQPNGTRTIDCRDGVVIIEGLHALNPALTERLPADAALCLYAGLREEYAAPDSTRCLATRDIRLARRLVRDCLFRGHGAAFTLGLWGKVCAGEDQYIKPFKPRADLLLDTTHTYEVCLWHALLDTMPPDEDLTVTQRRQLDTLRARFAAFPPLDTALVPADSMLREFIGA